MITRCEKVKDFKIVTKESQVDKQIKKKQIFLVEIL